MTAPWTAPAAFRVTGEHFWENYHRNLYQAVTHYVDLWNQNPEVSSLDGYNATTRGLQEVIQYALENHLEVRAVGGTWSWTPIATTDGIMLNTRPLNYRFRLAPKFVTPAGGKDPGHLLFAQCGMSVADLNRYLAARGQALRTSGASNGQTIAGALSTGTHGAALNVGSVPDFVHGLHLVTGPTRSFWIQRTKPVTVDFHQKLGAEPINDDAVFNAALVAFGSFGIIHGILLETDDTYFLQGYRQCMDLTPGLWKALTSLRFEDAALPKGPQNVHHFQAVFNPHERENQMPTAAHVTVMYRFPQKPADAKPALTPGLVGPGDNALELVAAITDLIPGIIPKAMSMALKEQYADYAGCCGTHGEIFTDTTTRGRTLSTAMGLPVSRAREAITLAIQEIQRIDAPALLAVRYVKASDGTLAFTNLGGEPHVCVMEMDGPWSARTREACDAVWSKLTGAGIPYTFHWGKVNNLDDQRVTQIYGQRVNAWLAARARLWRDDDQRLKERVFANAFLRKLNLHNR